MDINAILEQLPSDWLQQHWDEYLSLNEKIAMTVIQVKAHERRWPKPLHKPEDFDEFFAAEADRFGKTKEQIKGFFQQIAQTKAKEQVFEEHFGHLIPRDESGKPLIERSALDSIVGPDFKVKVDLADESDS